MDTLIRTIIANRYRLIHPLGESASSIVYAGESLKNKDELVAVKILKTTGISHRTEDLLRFYKETKILIHDSHHGIVRLYEAAGQNKHIYMILEYFRSKSLSTLLKEYRVFSIQQILTITIRLCAALEHLHNHDIIHRDLKPGNILIREKAGKNTVDLDCIKIKDSGLSQVKITGCDADTYLAPEQTGAFMKKIDARSDLYALGVILYELLTGSLPFTGGPADMVVHRHITQTPPPPSALNGALPAILDKVVLKLLEKEPGRRYQGVPVLCKDLEKILSGEIDFVPGAGDGPARLNFRTPLVGRKKERAQLTAAIDRAKKGKGSVCFIKGEPGIGKSRLADDCRDRVFEKGGVFIKAECFPGIKDTPFGLFIEALTVYTKIFFRNTKEKKLFLRSRLAETLGKQGRVIIDACPASADIIGDFPQLQKLNQEKEEIRFIHTLSTFFLYLARCEGLLVLFLDDLQWSDESNIKILNELAGTIDNFPFVVMCAYREPALEATSGLQQLGNTIPGQIVLKPFSGAETEAFLRQVFYPGIQDLQALTGFVFAASQGNPFFITEMIRGMTAAGSIYPHNNHWYFDRECLAENPIPAAVLPLLLDRVSRLEKQDRDILMLAAVTGKEFSIGFLCALDAAWEGRQETRPGFIAAVVEKAKQWQLIGENANEKGTFHFLHDRVKACFYGKIESNVLVRMHDLAGKLWESIYNRQTADAVYQVVYHFMQARNKAKLLQYIFTAGLKAKTAYAYKDAAVYLQIYLGLLRQSGQEGAPGWIACTGNLAEVYSIIGKNKNAQHLYEKILPLPDNQMHKAGNYMNLGLIHSGKGEIRQCEHYAKKGLALLGEKLPQHKYITYMRIPVEIIRYIIYHITKPVINTLFPFLQAGKKDPGNTEKYRLILRFFYALSRTDFFTDIPRFIYTVFHYINLCAQRPGLAGEYGIYMGEVGCVLMLIPLFRSAGRCLLHSMEITEQCGDPWAQGQALEFLGTFYQWQGQYGKSNTYLKQSLAIMQRIGDVKAMQNCIQGMRNNYWYIGSYTEALAANHEYYQSLLKADADSGFADAAAANAVLLIEQGQYAEAACWLLKLQHNDLSGKNGLACFYKLAYPGLLELYAGGLMKALEFSNKAYRIYKRHYFINQYTVYIFIYLCDVYRTLYTQQRNVLNQTKRARVKKKLAWYSRNAVRKTRKWTTYYGSALRVRAQYLALSGRYKKADTLFTQSILHSYSLGRKFELGQGYYAYGCFLHETGRNIDALKNWYEAYLLFKETGSRDLLKKVKSLLNFEEEEAIFYRLIRKRRDEQMLLVLKKTGALLNAEKSSSDMLDKVMDICMEWIGAQRGGLFKRDFFSNDYEILYSKSGAGKQLISDSFSAGIIYDVFRSGQAVIAADILTADKIECFRRLRFTEKKFVLCFPVNFTQAAKCVCYFDNLLTILTITKVQTDVLASIINMVVALPGSHSIIKEAGLVSTISRERSETLKEKYSLTNHEDRVLYFVLKGFSNREIIAQISISLQTLRTHLNHIYHKTGAKSREELKKIFSG